jgi:hypothetical protein
MAEFLELIKDISPLVNNNCSVVEIESKEN